MEQAPARHAEHSSGGDVVGSRHRRGKRVGQPGERRRPGNAEGDDGTRRPDAEDDGDEEGEDQTGKGDEHVDQPRQGAA